MQDFILVALPALVILVAYGKLRGRIKSLEAKVTAQHLAYQKLREASRELQAELKRLECRITVRDAFVPPVTQPEPKPEKPPLYRVVPEEPVISPPPSLPPSPAAEREAPIPHRAAHAAWENEVPCDREEEQVPSFFSSIPWRDILAKMHLLPPGKSESGETAESQIAAWWVIRIGLVLLIIAAVFFGVYVSQHTPAWLRVLTLTFVSLGTIGLGSRMKDKLEGFGRAIIGGGFALLYFTAFAAFALPATKIIGSPAVGAAAQFSALILAIIWSLWKRDQTVATLTLFLGFVSCGFSHSHDLGRFATVGLVLLAVTGSFLFATRSWLTPFVTSLVGAWSSWGAFALHDWLREDPPTFLHLMSSLVALTVVFEAGNFVSAARGQQAHRDRLSRWLILGNTSAAALLGYGVIRATHLDHLSTFYFIFAALYLAFTGVHYLRTADRAVTESLFLKSSALLCLGFAAAFSGPTRWLAIAFQAFALLWTARRSGSRWIAWGFVVALAASIGWFWRDLMVEPPVAWRWLDPFRIAGSIYLVFLTSQLGLHSRWFPNGIGGSDETHAGQARWFRVFGSFAIGFTALALSLNPSVPGRSDPVWFLFLLSIMIGLVSPLLRTAIPCVAAALPLVASYLAYAVLPQTASQNTAAILLGATLVVAAFGLCELIRRYWPGEVSGKEGVARELVLLMGLATLLPLAIDAAAMLSLSGNAALGLFALFPIVACAAVWCRRWKAPSGKGADLSTGFSIAVGILVVIGGAVTCEKSAFFPSALAVAGLPLLALAKRFRAWNGVIAGILPVLAGFLWLWHRLLEAQSSGLHDSINLAVLVVISTALAALLWRKLYLPTPQAAAPWADAVLHALSILSLHLFFQKHLGEGPDFLAASLLGLLLFVVSRQLPFFVLGAISWLPIALACAASIDVRCWNGGSDGDAWFRAAGAMVLAHLMAASHWRRDATRVPKPGFGMSELSSGIAVLAWTLITLAAAGHPWQAAGLTGVALLSSALWRWRRIPAIGFLGLGPLALAFCFAAYAIEAQWHGSATWTLTSVLLTAVGLAANGMIMASAERCVMSRRINASSPLPWVHAASALLLAFVACATDRLVSDHLTAVFWGLAAIVLFVSGLFAGLRAYRLTGLIGLVFCVGHIFIWDIQDTFYRIIAFFVIGLVMLAIGFLYHRFRERISALDS